MFRRFSSRLCHSRRVSSYCLLFPGQGSQHVGMGKDLIAAANSGSLPGVAELFQVAERVLGYDLRPLFLRGPQARLDETVHCQPAVVVASLAALKAAQPEVMPSIRAAAGFSVGEITALIAAQSLPLEQGLQVVKERATGMQKACQLAHSSMLTVLGLSEEVLRDILLHVRRPGLEVCIGNYLSPAGFVVSGHSELLEAVSEEAARAGAVTKEVRVSGAFHSPLMASAVTHLESVLGSVEVRMPAFPVYANVTGCPYESVEEIREGLALQLTHPVLWKSCVSHMIWDHLTARREEEEGDLEVRVLEVGPGRQLKAMLRRIDKDAYRKCDSLTV